MSSPLPIPTTTLDPRTPDAAAGARRRSRLLGRVALGLALVAGALGLAHLAEVRELAAVAARVRGSGTLTPAQTLERFTDFAYRTIRNPTYHELSLPVRLYYKLSPMHPGPGDVLRWGCDYRGGCGSHTRVVVAMLQASGIASRPLLLLDPGGTPIHTVVQARIGDRWVVADPSFGIVYHRRDGRLATAQEIAADTAWFHAQTAHAEGYNPAYDYDHVTAMNWRKVPVILPAIHDVSVALLGAGPVNDFARPAIWMWPRAILAAAFATLAALAGAAAWWSRRAAERASRAGRP